MNGKFNTRTQRSEQRPDHTYRNWTEKKNLSVHDGVERVRGELSLFGVLDGDAIISTNIPTRLDGLPRGDAKKPDDPGVAVYWQRPGDNGKTKVMAIDVYNEVADNLAAIAATLEAMRAIERHGGAIILDRAFQGFDALPAPGPTTSPWRDTLNLAAHETDAAVVKKNYLLLRSANHPDKGGSVEQFDSINRAWMQAQQELGITA